MNGNRNRQQGIALIMGMVMLVVITMLVVSALKTGLMNTRVISNMQFRDEATYAAQSAIERTLGDSKFVSDPAGVAGSAVVVDINGDGGSDYTVQMDPAPTCLSYRVLKYGELNLPADLPCTEGIGAAGSGASTFIPGGFAQKRSLCATTHWRISARTNSTIQSSSVQVMQGTTVRVDTNFAEKSCK